MLSPMRQALVEVMTSAGLVRRIGTNLNQAVARLNATGQRGDDLLPAAEFCAGDPAAGSGGRATAPERPMTDQRTHR